MVYGRHKSGARVLASSVAALLLVFSSSHPAAADHGYLPIGSSTCGGSPANCVSVGYDNQHNFIFYSVTSSMKTAVLNSMSQDYTPTDINMSETTHPAYADVYVYDADYGQNGVAGWVYCPSTASQGINAFGDRWCKGQTLKFNFWTGYSEYWDDTASKNHLACHELGHTVGLFHWYNTGSCMYPNWYETTYWEVQGIEGPAVLHAYDKNELNWYYPPY